MIWVIVCLRIVPSLQQFRSQNRFLFDCQYDSKHLDIRQRGPYLAPDLSISDIPCYSFSPFFLGVTTSYMGGVTDASLFLDFPDCGKASLEAERMFAFDERVFGRTFVRFAC